MDDPTLPNQVPGDVEVGRAHYKMTLETLKDMSDDELRELAAEAGIDGAQTMARDHLLAKLIDEPGANEL
jgi:hypothetical protein